VLRPPAAAEPPRTNWAGNHTYRARAVHAPSTLEELRDLVARLPQFRVLGSRHTFTDIGDSAELVTLERLPRDLSVDRAAATVRVGGAVRYGELAADLGRQGLALANLASLPHIAVAGAVATATHGSGERNGNLATAVAALEVLSTNGGLSDVARGDPDFDGLVVGLGAAGVVTALTLDVEPAFDVAQWVFESLEWERLYEHFDAIMGSGYSVSVFTRWGEVVDQVWVKERADASGGTPADELFGARAAAENRHPILGLDPVNCTPQLGRPGPWSERLPHFRMGFTPSSGAEIQSEYHVPRRHALAAIEAVRGLAPLIRPLTQVSEIRTIAADRLWMSPEYRRDAVAIHFTWAPDEPAVRRALAELEVALAGFAARPHWGKLFLSEADTIRPLYERVEEFSALLRRFDPRGALRNAWLESRVLGGRASGT
jgi:xylitol oxidase